MIEITIQNFEAEVIAASMTTPVLIDFWAPWCGPCKSLGPVLEQLEVDYGGRFRLAKVNSDTEQQLAGAFGIRSIPTCILMIGGKPVDGFAGALPAGQVKAFLDRHLPTEGDLMADAELDEAQALLAEGNAQDALGKLADALALNPGNDDARFDYIKLLIELSGFEEAEAALAPKLSEIPRALRFDALAHWLEAFKASATDAYRDWTPEQFDAHIAQNKRDFDARLAKARRFMTAAAWTEALDELLEIILRDKKWADETPRKTFVAILELMAPPKPKAAEATPGKTAGGIEVLGKAAVQQDPQAALVSSYRRKLSMALN
ncbi:MAG: thioredoxin [Rhodoferax sp.]